MIRLIRFLITGDWRLAEPPCRHTWEHYGDLDEKNGDVLVAKKLVLRCADCGEVKSVVL